jgi:hypothetical protein
MTTLSIVCLVGIGYMSRTLLIPVREIGCMQVSPVSQSSCPSGFLFPNSPRELHHLSLSPGKASMTLAHRSSSAGPRANNEQPENQF